MDDFFYSIGVNSSVQEGFPDGSLCCSVVVTVITALDGPSVP